jgi:Tfp pilus assembly protein PilF
LAHDGLGRALRGFGQAAEAQPHFDYVAEAEGALDRINRLLRTAVERPDDAEIRYEIGMSLLKYGSPDDGAKWLRTVLELDPKHQKAQEALAAYHRAGAVW